MKTTPKTFEHPEVVIERTTPEGPQFVPDVVFPEKSPDAVEPAPDVTQTHPRAQSASKSKED